MFRSASLFIGTSFTVAVFNIFATSNVDSIVGIPHKIYSMQRILIHIRSRSLCQMCPSAPRVCSEPGGQKPVLSLSLDRIEGYFKPWSWNYKVKVMGVVKGQDHTVSPVSNWFAFFCFTVSPVSNWFAFLLFQSENNSWDTAILKFDLEKSKVKVMGEVNGRGHIIHQYIPTNAPPFCFTSITPNIPEICPIKCLTMKKHILNFKRKFGKKISFQQNSSKI